MDAPIDLEAPLESLLELPMEKMSDQQLRDFVAKMHELRMSNQALAAKMKGGKKEQDLSVFDEFGENN